jgi:hypothetical protein
MYNYVVKEEKGRGIRNESTLRDIFSKQQVALNKSSNVKGLFLVCIVVIH